jgi:hypothetical protein
MPAGECVGGEEQQRDTNSRRAQSDIQRSRIEDDSCMMEDAEEVVQSASSFSSQPVQMWVSSRTTVAVGQRGISEVFPCFCARSPRCLSVNRRKVCAQLCSKHTDRKSQQFHFDNQTSVSPSVFCNSARVRPACALASSESKGLRMSCPDMATDIQMTSTADFQRMEKLTDALLISAYVQQSTKLRGLST